MCKALCAVAQRLVVSVLVALFPFLEYSAARATTYLPSVKIGTAALINPLTADTYYYAHGNNTSSDGLSDYTGVATPTPTEIVELARALHNNVDLIYEYVHNNIQTEWMYGLQKGALGTEIDKAGTPFDQAELMVALLRQGTTPYTVSYVNSTIAPTAAQFATWTGISSPRAACQLLANGGIPAIINTATNKLCSDAAFNGSAITSIQMAHIWVKVTINGIAYVFDPSFKTNSWTTGIDLGTAMGFATGTTGDPLTDVMSDSYSSGNVSGIPFVKALNTSKLNSDMNKWSSNLLGYMATHHLLGAQLQDVVGGFTITANYTQMRQSSLPYADTSPPYTRTWTPAASAARYNAIPDQYRTTLTVDGQTLQYPGGVETNVHMFTDANHNAPVFFSDEIYGRRLTVETDYNNPAGMGPGKVYYQRACIALDATPFNKTWTYYGADHEFHYTTPPWCLGSVPDTLTLSPLIYEYWLQQNADQGLARELPTHITLIADHPYVASANPSSTAADGDYMDTTLDKSVKLITPLTIVHGWGDVSGALFDKWSGERAADTALPVGPNPPICGKGEGDNPDYCPPWYQEPTGDFARSKMAANWLAQVTKAAGLNAAVGKSIPQLHHMLGFVYGDTSLQGFNWGRWNSQDPPTFTIGDTFDRVDVDSGISFTSKTADAPSRRAAIFAFATTSASLEGAVGAELADLPDTSSTATRFEWGNSPDPDPSQWGQNPRHIGPQSFLKFDGTNVGSDPFTKVHGLLLVDGGVASSCPGSGNSNSWTSPPLFSPSQCDGMTFDIATDIANYVHNGFTVVTSQEGYLGPGQRGGMIVPETVWGSGVSYPTLPSKQRGGAFVATLLSGSDPLEIAHIVTAGGSLNGPGAMTKGGGAGAEAENHAAYDPATAADILKSKFVDRSNLLGVNLSNGSMGYTSPISLRIGNGGFPFELQANISWHPGAPDPNWGRISPIAPPPGWDHSWQNNLSLSGSALEAMGRSDIRAAVGAIVAFYTAQDIYLNTYTPQREAAGVLSLSWWAHQLSGNVATVNIGGNARQFIQIADGTWILPGADYATMTQAGNRTAIENKCAHMGIDSDAPYALARGWDASNVEFQITNAHGDIQTFDYFVNNYHLQQEKAPACGRLTGFRLTTWKFPYGPVGGSLTITPTYTARTDPVGDFPDTIDYLTAVQNTLGRKLTFDDSSGNEVIADNSGISGSQISYTQPAGTPTITSSITDQLAKSTSFLFVGPYPDASPTQRPVPYVQLNLITAPLSPYPKQAEYDYDSLGRVYQVKDAQTLYQSTSRNPYQFFIADGTRGERDDPLGQPYTVYYDSYGHPSRYLDELQHETDALIDSRGRILKYVYPEGDCELFGYDDNNNTTSYKRVDKVSACDPNAGSAHVLSVSAIYDQGWNKPTQITDARLKTTTLAYHDNTELGTSLLETATRPQITEGVPVYKYDYNSNGQLAQVTDPDLIVTHNDYNAAGYLSKTTLDYSTGSGHLNLATSFGYDGQGNVTSTTDPRTILVNSCYDLARRKTEDDHHDGQTSALLAAERTIYDAIGRDQEDDRASGVAGAAACSGQNASTGITWIPVKTTDYTPTSKVKKVTDADGRQTQTFYDNADRISQVWDPLIRKTRFVYCATADANCAANQVKTEYRGWSSGNGCSLAGTDQECYRRVTYFPDGETKTLMDANGNTTTYGYDDFIRLTQTTFPGLTSELLTLDENGNVTSRRNRGGETLTYQYNPLNWMTQKVSPNPAVTTNWTYTLDGRIDLLTDTASNSINYSYDTAGRLKQTATTMPGFAASRVMPYQLDADGNRIKLTWSGYDSGYYVGYCYDNLNRMTVVLEKSTTCTDAQHTLATYAYDPLSRRQSVTYLNAASMAYTYTGAGDLLTLNHDTNLGANDPHYTFTYTAAHELLTEANSDTDYVWQPSVGAATTYTANNLNEYATVNGTTYGYDGKGNLASDGTWSFLYDAENRLLTANKTAGGTVAAAYGYDPLGRRNKKSGTGVTAGFYLNDGDDEVVDYDSGKTAVALYVPGPAIDEPIAMVTPHSDGQGGWTFTHEYFHTNHQGSVIAMSGDTGALAEGPFLYDPYGNCLKGATACSAVAGSEPFKFTGRRLDPETGCYYYRARYYCADDKRGGRFLQTDPVGYTADLNLYTYVGNDPIDRTDPTGNDWGAGCPKVLRCGGGGYGDIEGVNETYSDAPVRSLYQDIGSLASGTAAGEVVAANDKKPIDPGETGSAEHTKGARPSTEVKHQEGRGRVRQDRGREKADQWKGGPRRVPRVRPKGWKGPWPPNRFVPLPLLGPAQPTAPEVPVEAPAPFEIAPLSSTLGS